MKRLYCFFFFIIMFLGALAQSSKLDVHYFIQATLNNQNKTLDGVWNATYFNHSDTAINKIWIYLYPNAFASDKTQYSEDLLKKGNTSFYFGDKQDRGWIDRLHFVSKETVMESKIYRNNNEMIELDLSKALQPNDSIQISTPFFTQIPFNFEKNGYIGSDYELQVWCPLIAKQPSASHPLKSYSAYWNNTIAPAEYSVELNVPKGLLIQTNGQRIDGNTYHYVGNESFKWFASMDSSYFNKHKVANISADSSRKEIAHQVFAEIFKYPRAPEKPSKWLGEVYQQYHRPVPFLLDSFYYLNDTDVNEKKTYRLAFLYDLRKTDKYRYLYLSPAIGFNNYDKGMVGLLFHNQQLPQQPFSFTLAPLYAIGSKRFAGWGQMEYNIWQPRYHWQFGWSASTFSRRDFDIAGYPKFYQRMWRIVPSVNLTIFNPEASSTRKWDFGIQSFILSAQDYRLFTSATDTSFGNITERSTLFRWNAQLQDTRKLYPYSIGLVADAGKSFLRLGMTGKYFFNYDATNRGISARFFGGKFFYLKNQTSIVQSENEAYNFSLSGPSGIYDYTYSDYFIGRNESQGWMSQQIMERDGFFKIPSRGLSGGTIGISDDWLTALNLTADFPKYLDPLRHVGGGLKLFFDIGTYSDLWSDQPPAGRFLYDAGLQIALFKSLVNIYVPIVYSKVYKNALPVDKRFWKTISFNINLSALHPRNTQFLWPQ